MKTFYDLIDALKDFCHKEKKQPSVIYLDAVTEKICADHVGDNFKCCLKGKDLLLWFRGWVTGNDEQVFGLKVVFDSLEFKLE